MSPHQRPRHQLTIRKAAKTIAATKRYGHMGSSSSKVIRMPAAIVTMTASTRITGLSLSFNRVRSRLLQKTPKVSLDQIHDRGHCGQLLLQDEELLVDQFFGLRDGRVHHGYEMWSWLRASTNILSKLVRARS